MSILRLRDENGEVHEIMALVGRKGDDGQPGKDGAEGQPGKDGSPGKDGQNGKDGVSVTHSWNGTTLTVTSASGTSSANLKGEKGDPGSNATVTAASIKNALGYTPMNPSEYAVSVKVLGAKGDGSTDDTAVFQTALANNRLVYVPGGTYKLSGEIVIRDNCQLELAQDVVLNFTQTSGNCITVNRSSWLKGNHATIFVPYAFAGNVIYADTTLHTDARDVLPWTHYDPQWKTARYITNINICKFNGAGLHWSNSGDTAGTAVYISATGGGKSTFMWGTNLNGIRIAGAFEYGIRAQNFNKGWCHEMRIEAFIECCKIGLSLEDSNKVYFSGSIQPNKAADGTLYAKHGIQIIRSIDTELSGARVWDWCKTEYPITLWTPDKTNINQHIAMYGNCSGTILNDYLYDKLPAGFTDIRELIYTDTPSNFDSLIILQEPFTKWFKPVNSEPYFNDGSNEKRLVLKEEQDALFQTDYIPTFTDRLATASDGAGGIFNEIGYKKGYAWSTSGTLSENPYYTATGFIKCQRGSVINVKDMAIDGAGATARIVFYNSNFERFMHVNRENVVSNASTSFLTNYSATEDGFTVQIANGGSVADVAYITITLNSVGSNPAIAVDEEIGYTQVGTLASGIKVNEQNLFGMEGYEKKGRMVSQISASSTNEQYPTAKAVYDALNSALGEYVTDIAALIGGGA